MTLKEMLAEVGPKTQDAFFDLLYKCNIRDGEFERTLDLEVLAAETGPETMSAHRLLEIVQWAVHARELPLFRNTEEEESLAKLQNMGAKGVKVSLNDLAKKVKVSYDHTATTHTRSTLVAFMSFAEKVGNGYDVYRDAPFAVDKLAAETGPGTMPASQLLALVLEVLTTQ